MRGSMVLNEAERLYAASLLRYVTLQDLEAVAQTVTKGMVTPTSFEECVKIIIYHSDTPKSLLSRKKITRDVLFKYLYDNSVLVTASMDKTALVDQVLKLWNNNANRYHLGELKQISQRDEQVPDHATGGGEVVQKAQQHVDEQSNTHINHPSENEIICDTSVPKVTPGLSHEEVNELALKFSERFYKMLNIQGGVKEKLGPEHFWQKCGIYLSMIFSSGSIDLMRKGALHVVEVLQDMKQQHGLYFNPNLSMSGVRGKLDPHGLVMVFACGTLHQSQDCIGVFEQMFLLARDPFSSGSWKVKFTKLQLRSTNVDSVPELQEECMPQLLGLSDHD